MCSLVTKAASVSSLCEMMVLRRVDGGITHGRQSSEHEARPGPLDWSPVGDSGKAPAVRAEVGSRTGP